MRLTRHARRRLRLYRLSEADVSETLIASEEGDFDEHDNPRFTASVRGRRIVVVVAKDQPDLVITAYTRRP